MNITHNLMAFWIYIFPVPASFVLYWAWLKKTGNPVFSLFVLLLPLLYGYIIPGIGTNILKKWRFRGKMLMGNYFLHHGFIYTANMNLLLFLSFAGFSEKISINALQASAIIICTAMMHGYLFWLNDIFLIKLKMVEIFSPPHPPTKSPEEIAFSYAPLCFFLIGLTYAISSIWAYEQFVILQHNTFSNFALLLSTSFLLIASIPSIGYGICEKVFK